MNFACTNASFYGAGVTKEVMFQAVQDYLQGANDQSMDIRLSLPVTIVHVLSSSTHQFMVCAFLGAALNNSPPIPNDPKISIW
ncbi:hypothetical protein TCAL_16678 [Tigriopus californicus]|uniref:Uncharacterized protein n=1 Tax=Tigriopus californicus TaxID=6832 RepID=A0A553PJB3_TIGCA|nr:hypothetical protein TCAL_16678 [Tigriopus californicus]